LEPLRLAQSGRPGWGLIAYFSDYEVIFAKTKRRGDEQVSQVLEQLGNGSATQPHQEESHRERVTRHQ
jgi:hypothetical protein